jgi:hypothetical protein
LDDAIDRELTQIEANEFAYFWQESGEGTYEDGLETFNEKRLKEHKEFLDYMKRKPSWNWERDADGRLRPVAIEAGLKALMSYPGFRGCRAHEARERHFTAFLAATLAAEHPERSAEEMCAAGRRFTLGRPFCAGSVSRRESLSRAPAFAPFAKLPRHTGTAAGGPLKH